MVPRRLKRKKVQINMRTRIKHAVLSILNVVYDRSKYMSALLRIVLFISAIYYIFGTMVLLCIVVHYCSTIHRVRISCTREMRARIDVMRCRRWIFPLFPFYSSVLQMHCARFRRKHKKKRLYEIKARDGKWITFEMLHRSMHSRTAMLIIHGFNGSSGSKYVRNLAYQAAMPVVCLNWRGIRRRTSTICHVGSVEDIEDVLVWMGKTWEICVVGYSLGGARMAKVMGMIGMYEIMKNGEQGGTVSKDMRAKGPIDFVALNKAAEVDRSNETLNNNRSDERTRINEVNNQAVIKEESPSNSEKQTNTHVRTDDVHANEPKTGHIVQMVDGVMSTNKPYSYDVSGEAGLKSNGAFNTASSDNTMAGTPSGDRPATILNSPFYQHDRKHMKSKVYNALLHTKILCCVGVCVPFNFSKIYKSMATFPRSLMQPIINHKYHAFLKKNKIRQFKECTTLEQYNSEMARIHGYADIEEYFSFNSCERFVKYVRVPTLFVVANDDLLVARHTVDVDALNNDNVAVWCMNGGHVGFLDNTWESYCDEVALEFMRVCVK